MERIMEAARKVWEFVSRPIKLPGWAALIVGAAAWFLPQRFDAPPVPSLLAGLLARARAASRGSDR
jgi:hypothetical protein